MNKSPAPSVNAGVYGAYRQPAYRKLGDTDDNTEGMW
jgi:hypothetical protein